MSAPAVATPAFHLTAKVAVAPRGTVSIPDLLEALRIDPLARRPRI